MQVLSLARIRGSRIRVCKYFGRKRCRIISTRIRNTASTGRVIPTKRERSQRYWPSILTKINICVLVNACTVHHLIVCLDFFLRLMLLLLIESSDPCCRGERGLRIDSPVPSLDRGLPCYEETLIDTLSRNGLRLAG